MAGSSLPARRRSAARTLLTTSGLLAVVSGFLMLLAVAVPVRAYAAIVGTVNLRTVDSFSVLGGQTVTNTGPSTLDGDLGVSPGDAITGFPPGTVGGATYKGNAKAAQAQRDLTRAYNDADGRPKVGDNGGTVPVDLVGLTLVGGVYESSGALELSGALTLNGEGNSDSVWIFKSSSTLVTASNSSVRLTNGADACNVFWQVDSSATIGTDSDFVGTIMALASVTAQTGATIDGRALARNGAVTLDSNVFQSADCDEVTDTPTSTVTVTAPPVTTTATTTTTATVTEVPAGGESVTPTVTTTRTATQTATITEVPVGGESATETVTATVTAGGGGGEQSTNGTRTYGTGGGNNNGGGTDNGSGGDSTGYLASTGSDVMSPYLGVAGLALLLVGGLLLARGHGRTRTSGKHR